MYESKAGNPEQADPWFRNREKVNQVKWLQFERRDGG